MDIKLENLIEKIKKDGIEEAEKTKQKIIEKARQEAKTILQKASEEAETLVKKAASEAEKLKNSAENSLKQAARDLALSLKQEIGRLFNDAFKRRVDAALDEAFTAKLITSIVERWSFQGDQSLEVLVSAKQQKEISEFVLNALKEDAKDKIEIKCAKSVSQGFMIGVKDQDLVYDFTDESILESLKAFLNPTVKDLLKSE